MMRWLVKFIDQNRYAWERRRQIEEEERDMNAAYEDWLAKDKESQIEEIKAKKQQEVDSEKRKEQRQEKARIRKMMWKDWRNTTEDAGTRTLPREGVRELPGQDNSLLNTGDIPEKLGGDDPGGRGTYQELLMDSTAPCNTGPHTHLEALEPDEQRNVVKNGDDDDTRELEMMRKLDIRKQEEIMGEEERIKMEIMLGMTQEEGVPCLLCLMPRCICHLTLDLTIIETKLLTLRNKEVEKEVKEEAEDPPGEGEVEGDLGGLLEGGGLTPPGEGSSPPQEPAGNLDTKPEEEQKAEKERPPDLMQRMREMMVKAEKQEEAEKSRKAMAKKRREEARKKEDRQEATKTRSVKQMLENWKLLGETSGTGKSPTKLESARNILERKTGTAEGRKQGTPVRNKLDTAVRKASPTPHTLADKGKIVEPNIVRKKETAVGEDQEHRKLAEKEHELARNQPSTVRKHEPQQNTPRVGEGKYNLIDIVRKPAGEGSQQSVKLEVRNKERQSVKKDPCLDMVLDRKVRKSRISDLIQNFNGMQKGGEASHVVETMNRNKVGKAMVMVEEMSSTAKKRKASEVEEEIDMNMRTSAKNRKLVAAARNPSSSRDNTILKYFNNQFKTKHSLASNDSTGDVQGPVQTAGHGGGRVHSSQGVGEHVHSAANIATPDALASSDVKQLPE